MSKYTTEVRFICETACGYDESQGEKTFEQIIRDSRASIFNFSYPIFDENYRSVIESKILKHYYTREISEETVGLWKLRLNTRMNEIMPYYNQLYKSELIEFNPMYDVDLTTDHKRDNAGTRNDVGTSSGNTHEETNGSYNGHTTEENERVNDHWDYYSDTPQGTVGDLADLSYLTNARHITDNSGGSTVDTNNSGNNIGETNGTTNGNTTNNSNMNSTEDYLQHVKGKNGGASYSKLLAEYRDTFLNIDMLVIRDLADLFFTLW